MMNPKLKKVVLLVEDDAGEALLTKKACEHSGIPHRVVVVESGEAAIEYLKGSGSFSDRELYPMPDMMFLDLKLVRIGGLEVLKWLRDQPSLQDLPVVVFTASESIYDITEAYRLGVSSYLLKSSTATEFNRGIRVILKYWLEEHG